MVTQRRIGVDYGLEFSMAISVRWTMDCDVAEIDVAPNVRKGVTSASRGMHPLFETECAGHQLQDQFAQISLRSAVLFDYRPSEMCQ